jgi:hypothetical protein
VIFLIFSLLNLRLFYISNFSEEIKKIINNNAASVTATNEKLHNYLEIVNGCTNYSNVVIVPKEVNSLNDKMYNLVAAGTGSNTTTLIIRGTEVT